MLKFITTAALAFATATAAQAGDSIVANGSFESVDLSTGRATGWTYNPYANRPWITSFTNLPGAGERAVSTGCVGASCIDPTSAFANYLFQDLNTVAGTEYTLSFTYIFSGSAQGEQILNVLLGDELAASLDFKTNYDNGLQTYTGTFTATDAVTRLTFLARNDPSWMAIDQVSVVAIGDGAVPEPASWALMIAGFGLVGGTLRRRGRNLQAA
jgi:hypothetical protein